MPVAIVVAFIVGAGTLGGVILFVVAGIMLASAATAFCPTYTVAGISTYLRGLRRVGHHLRGGHAWRPELGEVRARRCLMQLEQRDKELAAIGASIGCNCRPCIEHHIPAGREAGLSDGALADAVATARAVRDEAVELLAPRVDELLGHGSAPAEPAPVAPRSRAHELVCLGASVGANSHPLLERHIAAALALEMSSTEVAAAARMGGYVQKRASEMTADKATQALDELAGVAGVAGASQSHNTRRGKELES